MGKLTDVAIRAWIKAGERFEGRTDGEGMVLTWRPDRTTPQWRLRYRFAGKSRVMNLGSYTDLPLAAVRQSAKELRAKIALGHDVAGEKQSASPPPWPASRPRAASPPLASSPTSTSSA